MAFNRQWFGISAGCLLFVLVFAMLNFGVIHQPQFQTPAETGLLLFVVPGVISSHLSPGRCVVNPLLGSLLAFPACLLIHYHWLAEKRAFWQVLAYLSSAIFWCALGALCYLCFLQWRGRVRERR